MATQREGKGLYFNLGSWRFGFEYSPITMPHGGMYMERWILYCGPIHFRLHKFHRGDDERAPHDHPFWFITLPFTSYVEIVPYAKVHRPDRWFGEDVWWSYNRRTVRAWRFHFRPAEFKHIVLGREDGSKEPFWTFVIAGAKSRLWGFWRDPDSFTPWYDWE